MKAPLYSVLKIIVISIIGCLNHFMYEWTGNNFLIGLFTPVNESIWEHLKLLFFPVLFFMAAEYIIYGHRNDNFLFSGTSALLTGLVFIPAAYYTYTAVTGRGFFIADLIIYFLTVIISARKGKSSGGSLTKELSAALILLCLAVLFAGFTVYPPDSPLFISPV